MAFGEEVWIVGKCIDAATSAWEFQGVYSSEERAVAACLSEQWFIGPARVDEPVPARTEAWPGARYPHAGTWPPLKFNIYKVQKR